MVAIDSDYKGYPLIKEKKKKKELYDLVFYKCCTDEGMVKRLFFIGLLLIFSFNNITKY